VSLSSVIKAGDSLVVVSVVLSGRNGECEAMQVMTAASTAARGRRAIRMAGYKRVRRMVDGGLRMTAADLELAVRHVGLVFERSWLGQGPWKPAVLPDPGARRTPSQP
jgi:hypothetical protein